MEVKVENVSYLIERNELITNINKNINNNNNGIRQNKELLLQDINLKLEPGSVTVFVGNSIGQKRLLECIALRPMDGYMAGNIQYDSALRKGGAFKDIAFVTSDIGYVNHFHSLSVFDYLYYCARLR
jgi:ABC-type multidrug transport system ATPase subunit